MTASASDGAWPSHGLGRRSWTLEELLELVHQTDHIGPPEVPVGPDHAQGGRPYINGLRRPATDRSEDYRARYACMRDRIWRQPGGSCVYFYREKGYPPCYACAMFLGIFWPRVPANRRLYGLPELEDL